ncbi:MAG: hypothetical protein Q9159_007285 [Coniocarpon cinnabarinum]
MLGALSVEILQSKSASASSVSHARGKSLANGVSESSASQIETLVKQQRAFGKVSYEAVFKSGLQNKAKDPLRDVIAAKYARIVAIHGLDGHREDTWTTNGVNWLRELLPTFIPSARIMTWGYDARTHGASPISRQRLHQIAEELVQELSRKRFSEICDEVWLRNFAYNRPWD